MPTLDWLLSFLLFNSSSQQRKWIHSWTPKWHHPAGSASLQENRESLSNYEDCHSGIHRKGSEEEQVPPWLEEIGLLYWILNHEGVQVLKEGWKRLRLWGDRKWRQLGRKRLVKPHKGMSMNLFNFIIFNLFGVCVVCVHACHRTEGRRQSSSLFEKGSLCCSPLCTSGQLAGPWASGKTRCYCTWLYVGSENSISLSKQVLYLVCRLS